MIRVTVEIIPFGIGAPEKIGYAEICNIGGTEEVAKYKALVYEFKDGQRSRTVSTKIPRHVRGEGIWALIGKMVGAIPSI